MTFGMFQPSQQERERGGGGKIEREGVGERERERGGGRECVRERERVR